MKIKGTKEFEIEISDEQAAEIAINYIYEKFNWDASFEIGYDGWVYGYYPKIRIRFPEVCDYKLINFLEEFKRKNFEELQKKEEY